MRCILFLSISTLAVTFLFSPTIAEADTITWSSGTYRAYAYAKAHEGIIYDESEAENFSPPDTMPISASAYAATWNGSDRYPTDVYGDADSIVTNSSFNVSVAALSW